MPRRAEESGEEESAEEEEDDEGKSTEDGEEVVDQDEDEDEEDEEGDRRLLPPAELPDFDDEPAAFEAPPPFRNSAGPPPAAAAVANPFVPSANLSLLPPAAAAAPAPAPPPAAVPAAAPAAGPLYPYAVPPGPPGPYPYPLAPPPFPPGYPAPPQGLPPPIVASAALSDQDKKVVLALLFFSRLAAHFDVGAVAAVLADDERRFSAGLGLDGLAEGRAIFLEFCGLAVGVLFVGSLLQAYGSGKVVKVFAVCSVLATGTMTFTQYASAMQAKRFAVGVASGLATVLSPLWIDENAGTPRRALFWHLFSLSGALFGAALGFASTGFALANAPRLTWRLPFFVQVAAFCGAAFFWLSRPAFTLDVKSRALYGALGVQSLGCLKRFARNPLLLAAGAALATLCCVAAGAFYWFGRCVLAPSARVSAPSFNAAVAVGFAALLTAIPGGGFAGCKSAGLSPFENPAAAPPSLSRSLCVGFTFSALAAGAGWTAAFVNSFGLFSLCFYGLFFAGAAAVPCAVHCVVFAVPEGYRGIACSLSTFVNCCAFAVGGAAVPYAGHWLPAYGADGRTPLDVGYRAVLMWSAAAPLLLAAALACSRCRPGTEGPRQPALGGGNPPPASYETLSPSANPVPLRPYQPYQGSFQPSQYSGSTGAGTRYDASQTAP
ncbi:hypothetical protein DIPPA_31431 [Diplonema papillatum]|nr:hypothetical protein DIPPA_31431 [Diplonema papillatum]